MRKTGKSADPNPDQRVKWQAVADGISRHIREGEYGPSGFLPAERLLCEQYGVSRPTVRKALQSLAETGLVDSRPGVGRRVLDGHFPQKPIPGIKIIALGLPDIVNRFFVEVTEAIEYTLLQRGYHLLLSSYRHQSSLQELQIRQFASQRVQGVILGHDSGRELPSSAKGLQELEIPVVLLFNAEIESPFDSVVVDERAGVAQVMRYLFSLGHRRIAFCRPVTGTQYHLREKIYRELMAKGELPVPEHFVLPLEYLEGDGNQVAVGKLFAGSCRPTAIFAGNDRVALMVMKHLASAGLRVPQEVSVVGFDNLSFTEHLPVPLTTVDQPKDVLGRRAAELLLERVEFRIGSAPRREIHQPRLVVRESCARVQE